MENWPHVDEKQGEQSSGFQCKPKCGEAGCSDTEANSGRERGQFRTNDANGNVSILIYFIISFLLEYSLT